MKNPFDCELTELPLIEVQGSFREMGQQFGEAGRQQIAELYEIRLNSALNHAAERGRRFSTDDYLKIAAGILSLARNYHPEGYEETLGIAEGAGLSPEQIFILQGLTDLRDFLSWGTMPDGFGCTSMIISAERSKNGQKILAQNWDLQTDNMPYVCFVRRTPDDGPSTLSLTVSGGLCMIGLNSEGLAIGTNNIKTTDTRPGVHYLNIIHKFLAQRDYKTALSCIEDAPRCGAHYYMTGSRNDGYAGIECSALLARRLDEADGIITHCNHPLHPDIDELNAEDMGPSTRSRQKRIDCLTGSGKYGFEDIKEMLSDLDGKDLAICRHNVPGDISTNASVIIFPEEGKIHACRSFPHSATWQSFTF